MKLIYIPEPFVFHPGACFLATNAAGTIHENRLVFLTGEEVFHHREFFTKGVHIGQQSILEMTYFTFIMVAHVHNNGVGVVSETVELTRVEMRAGFGCVERFIVKSIGHDLLTYQNLQFEKRPSIVFNGYVQPDPLEKFRAIQITSQVVHPGAGNADLSVYTLFCNINPPQGLQTAQIQVQLIPPGDRIVDTDILIKGYCGPVLWRRMQLFLQNSVAYTV